MRRTYGIDVKILDVETPVNRKICVPIGSDATSTADRASLMEMLINARN
jgi:hypothetical protein